MKSAFIFIEAAVIVAMGFTVLNLKHSLDDDNKVFRMAGQIIQRQYDEIHACEHAGQDTSYHGSGL